MKLNRRFISIMLALLLTLGGASAIQAQTINNPLPISYGESVTITFDATNPESYFTFSGTAGDVIVINLISPTDTDTYLCLGDATNPVTDDCFEALDYDDDGGTGLNSRILGFELPATGSYIIRATTFGFRSGGDVRTGTAVLSLDLLDLIPLVLDESVTATFAEGNQVLYFSYEGTAGQVVNVTVDSSSSLDSMMTIIHPFEYDLYSNEDQPGTVDPGAVELVLDTDGTYFIILEPQNPNAVLRGDITVTISVAQLASLDEGPVTVTLNSDRSEQVLTFAGVTGEVIQMTFIVVNQSDFSSVYIEIIQNSETVASVGNIQGVSALTIEFTTPGEGDVNVSIESFGDATLDVILKRNPQ